MSQINKTFGNGQPLDASDLNQMVNAINNAVPVDAQNGVSKDGDNYYIRDANGNVLTIPKNSVGSMVADYIKSNASEQAKITFGASSLQALQTTIGQNLYGATTAEGLASVVAGKRNMMFYGGETYLLGINNGVWERKSIVLFAGSTSGDQVALFRCDFMMADRNPIRVYVKYICSKYNFISTTFKFGYSITSVGLKLYCKCILAPGSFSFVNIIGNYTPSQTTETYDTEITPVSMI